MVGLNTLGNMVVARASAYNLAGTGRPNSIRSNFVPERKGMPNSDTRVDPPSHRHAAPSAPWPWVDIGDEVDAAQLRTDEPPIPELCPHENCNCWTGYPASRFPNWTAAQVKKSKIWDAREQIRDCTIFRCDVDTRGRFRDVVKLEAKSEDNQATWEAILTASNERTTDLRVKALFVHNMSGPVMQMLGARFNIEPFFFSSSLNWIPSRFQEEIKPNEGDHITITLPFIKASAEGSFQQRGLQSLSSSTLLGSQHIDTQRPLHLSRKNKFLALDLISVHLIRNIHGSTIISYHSDKDLPVTTANFLHQRICFAGQSVYWQSMFQISPDPTLVLMCFIWHALYAWDEALETLYGHILSLETTVIETAHMKLTQELHIIRAHHLHYSSLLDEFMKNIEFIEETENPFMTVANFPQEKIDENKVLLHRECKNLKQEVKRLKDNLHMQERRLKNVMNLVFSSVNIADSKYMKKMTEAAVRDSAAMKQIAYLTMVFLPATFVAGVFGMNVSEINPEGRATIPHYVAVALPLTAFTAWIIVAFQSRYIFQDSAPFWHRLAWPFVLLYRWMTGKPVTFPSDPEPAQDDDEMETADFIDDKVPYPPRSDKVSEDIRITVEAGSPTAESHGWRSNSLSLSHSLGSNHYHQ